MPIVVQLGERLPYRYTKEARFVCSVPDKITGKIFAKPGNVSGRPKVEFDMIPFRLRGEIGGAATSLASDVQVGRSRSLRFMLCNQH